MKAGSAGLRVFLLAAALGAASAGCPTSHHELDVVRLVIQSHFSNIPLLLADAKGHFRRQGILIERVPLEQGSQALPLLIRGDVDAAAMASTINLLSAVERGARIRIIANKGVYQRGHCAQSALVARADWAPPAEAAALREYVRGRTIAITNATGTSHFLSRVLDSIGLEESDVELVTLPQAAKLDALASGRVDLAHLGEPHLTRSRSAGFVKWLSAEEISDGLDHAYVVAAPRLWERDRDLGARFLAGYLDGVAEYRDGKTEENVAIVSRETSLAPELVREACWPAVRADGAVDLTSIREMASWAVERSLLDRAPEAEQVVDSSLLEEARRHRAIPAP